MQSRTVRRLILGAAFGAAGALAFAAPANADDSQQPGGVLDTVVEVVDQVAPKPTKAPEPEHTKEPEAPAEPQAGHGEEPGKPEQNDEADHGTDEQQPADGEPEDEAPTSTTPPADPIEQVKDGLEQVVEPVKDAVEDVTTPTPIPSPPVVVVPVPPTPAPVATPTQPAQPAEPAPLDEPTTIEAPTEREPLVPAVDLPDLPTVIGPVGSTTMLPGIPPAIASAEEPAPAPQCTGDRDDQAEPDHGRGVVRTITDRRGRPPAADRKPAPVKPCPTPVGPDGQAFTAGSVKPPPPTGEQLVALTAGGAYSPPVLHRLTQLRPRGDIPAGRTEHPEPGPA
ncbi:hypothetical protein PSN13_06473 [Micromonospora saelicesensis]|uniref:Uncharacterized protein n=1 Tax=Micromonospora saelicesensis TaxID=285676 RepID=A0A328NGX6_9ACTN|nr:hypothetical protein [Micromonospora saelicesensis]RAO26445.1 hypothetical protein PSN13_06473 [Micromonospora saelicesensis]